MFAYLGFFVYFATGAVVNGLRPIRADRALLIFTAILLILVIGFRWHVGADWRTYEAILQYSEISNSAALNLSSEPLYALLNWIAAYQGWGIWFPNLVCATVFTFGLLAFSREQPNPWLALLVALPYLIIGVGMGYTRQSAALGLIMIALVQLTRGAHLRVFLCLGLATMFHASAIALAPLFAIASVRRAFVTGVILVIFGVLLYFAFSQRIAMRMSEYSTYRYSAAGAIPRLVMNAFPGAIFLMSRRRFTTHAQELRLWTLFSLVSFITLPMLYFVNSTTIIDRLGIFLVPLQIFVLSRLPRAYSHTTRQNMMFVVLIILYSLVVELVWLNFGNESQSWKPYRNYLWETWFEGKTL